MKNEKNIGNKTEQELFEIYGRLPDSEFYKLNVRVFTMGFYGNRTVTEIGKSDFNEFLGGEYVEVNIPDAENLIAAFNNDKNVKFKDMGCKPLVVIGDTTIYGTCVICRKNIDGTYENFEKEDFNKIEKYLMD